MDVGKYSSTLKTQHFSTLLLPLLISCCEYIMKNEQFVWQGLYDALHHLDNIKSGSGSSFNVHTLADLAPLLLVVLLLSYVVWSAFCVRYYYM